MTPFIPTTAAIAILAAGSAFADQPVPVAQFNSVDLRGGGEVHVVPGPQRVDILEGSPAITNIYVDHDGSLKIDACRNACPKSYHLSVEIHSPRVVPLAVDGGGSINVGQGFSPQNRLAALVNGGGKIDTRALDAGDVSAVVNDGGELFVRAATRLAGVVRGGGDVRYWGNPRMKSSSIVGGGSIRPGE